MCIYIYIYIYVYVCCPAARVAPGARRDVEALLLSREGVQKSGTRRFCEETERKTFLWRRRLFNVANVITLTGGARLHKGLDIEDLFTDNMTQDTGKVNRHLKRNHGIANWTTIRYATCLYAVC